jgi:hypothetical protein
MSGGSKAPLFSELSGASSDLGKAMPGPHCFARVYPAKPARRKRSPADTLQT